MDKIARLKACRAKILHKIQDLDDFKALTAMNLSYSVKKTMAGLRIEFENQLSRCNQLIRIEESKRVRHKLQ